MITTAKGKVRLSEWDIDKISLALRQRISDNEEQKTTTKGETFRDLIDWDTEVYRDILTKLEGVGK